MKQLIDLHVHTISSGHAYSTLQEVIQYAKSIHLPMVGISDHAPGMPGGAHLFHFFNMRILPKEIDGVRILKGVEVNIMDHEGNIDVDQRLLSKTDYAIASLHPPCIPFGDIKTNTETLIKVMSIEGIQVIGHPDDERYPLDYDALAYAAKEHNVLLEINNSSMNGFSARSNSKEVIKDLLSSCKLHETHVIFGSDAHISFDVGNFTYCKEIVEECDFPMELVVNHQIDKLKQFFPKIFQ
ncbi:MAG: phosphatase [Firmicutes bacterium HGW-Firmicutes-19]|jgi:putative hydrolase|nr:MAG: phosphatase [Firmicutes bacterium HGW-Firmicutes-19]